MPKIQEKNGQYSVTIPKQFVKCLGLKKGEVVMISPDQNEQYLIIKREHR